MFLTPNLRLIARDGEIGGGYIVYTRDKLEHALQTLIAFREAEPARGWRVQVRGFVADWHNAEPATLQALTDADLRGCLAR